MSEHNHIVVAGNIIFMGIPRAANTSVRQAVLDVVGHFGTVTIEEALRRRRNGAFVFTFVRHPYERFLSLWKSSIRDGVPTDREGLWPGMDILEFAKYIFQEPDATADFHFCSQTSMLIHEHKLVPGYIGRVETFDEDWKNICQTVAWLSDIELPAILEKLNCSAPPVDAVPYPLKSMLAQRYASDFTVLGYIP